MRCGECSHWTTRRITLYAGGQEIENWKAPEGRGACSELGIETAAVFGCNSFSQATFDPIHIVKKNGAPWQNFRMGGCPDCNGAGSSNSAVPGCHRCAGTGQVRFYDDGYVGEEQTRLHPKEKDASEPIKCHACGNGIEINWVACPHCGVRLLTPSATEVVHVEGLSA